MDIERLIETLRQHGVSCVRTCGKYCSICDEAATALSTLQAENEKLKDQLYDGEGVNLVNYWMQQAKIEENGHRNCQAENEKLRAELDDLRIQWDMYGGDVGITAVYKELKQAKRCIEIVEKQRDAAIKELENYMVQDVLDGNEPCKICAKASDIPCEYCNPKWRGPQKEE